MTERLTVDLGERSYPILIGEGMLGSPDLLAPFTGAQALVVTNRTVADHYLDRLRQSLRSEQVDVSLIGDGEQHKTLDTYAVILDALARRRHHRTTCVVALGGGVVGDVAGFAAATYQRGVDLVAVPTTLLAMVDSSVGGKTAVNHSAGKNLIGAFHQPRAVIADMTTLATLPQREYRAGLAEVIKYGVIADADLFGFLEANVDGIERRESAVLRRAIRRSCEIKAAVVRGDERELGGRALLNFGHTFGHAIEALTGYAEYLHGEAVAIGMAMAMALSARLDHSLGRQAERVRELLARVGLPTTARLAPDAVLDAMGMDKKVRDGRLRLIICDGLGRASITDAAPTPAILGAIESRRA